MRTREHARSRSPDIFISRSLDLDFSTRDSAAASARVAAEEQAVESTGLDAAAVGQRSERLLGWLAKFGRGLSVKTRSGLTSFGAEDDEIRYLHDLVRRAIHRV